MDSGYITVYSDTTVALSKVDKNSYSAMITMSWDGTDADFDFEVLVYNPTTGEVQYLSANSESVPSMAYVNDRKLNTECPEVVTLDSFDDAYYLVRVVPASDYASDGVNWDASNQKENINNIEVNFFAKGISRTIFGFYQPIDFYGDSFWVIGCFHQGGLDYLRAEDMTYSDTSFAASDCSGLYTTKNNLDNWDK
jgi:hypothetical protein